MDLDIVEVFPQLDNTPQKGRSELAQKGSLGHRRPPTRAGIRAFVSSVWDGDVPNDGKSVSSPGNVSPPPLHQNGKKTSDEENESEPREDVPSRGWKRPPKHAVLVFPMQLLNNNNRLKEDDDDDVKKNVKEDRDDDEEELECIKTTTKTGPTIVSITLKSPEKRSEQKQQEILPTQVLIRPYDQSGSKSDDLRSWERLAPNSITGNHNTVVFLNRDNTPSPASSRASSPAQERLTRRDSHRSNVHIQTWERRRASPSPSPSPSRARLRDLVMRPASISEDTLGRRERIVVLPSSRRSSPSGYRHTPIHEKPEWLHKIDLERRRGIDWENLEKQRKATEETSRSPTRSEPRGRSSSDSFLLERDSLSRRSDGCRRWNPSSEPEWIQIARRRRQSRIDWETIDERPTRSGTPEPRHQKEATEAGEDVGVQVNLNKKKKDSGSIVHNILSKVRGGNDDELKKLPLVIHSSTGSDKKSSERGWRQGKKEATSPTPKWTEREVLIEDLPRTQHPQPKSISSPPLRVKGVQPKSRVPPRVRSPSPLRRRHPMHSPSPTSSESELEKGPDTPSSKKKVRFMISKDKKIPTPTPSAGYTLFGMDPPRNPSSVTNKENVPLDGRSRKAGDRKSFLLGNNTKGTRSSTKKSDEQIEGGSEDDYQLQAYQIIRRIKQLTKERSNDEAKKGSRDSSPETSGRQTPDWLKKTKQKSCVNWESLEERPMTTHNGDGRPPVWTKLQLKRTPFSKKYFLHDEPGSGHTTDDDDEREIEFWVEEESKNAEVKRSDTNVADSEGYSSMESSGGPMCVHCGHPQEEWPYAETICKDPCFKRGPQTKTVRKTLRRILRGPDYQTRSRPEDEEIVEEITEEVFDLPSKTKTKKHIIRTVQQTKDGRHFLSTTIAADDAERA